MVIQEPPNFENSGAEPFQNSHYPNRAVNSANFNKSLKANQIAAL